MDNASYFIKNKALFGSYPTQESLKELEDNNVKYFIDLTQGEKEKNISLYTTKYNYINYPIADNYIPHNWRTFSVFILKICNIIKNLKNSEKCYVHCRGGHSRSGLVVACLICYIFDKKPHEAIEYTTKCHNNRKNIREKWKKLCCPQSFLQKKFIYKFFENLKFYELNRYNIFTYGFSMRSHHNIETEIGNFKTVKEAYDEYINIYLTKNEEDYDIEGFQDYKIQIMTDLIKNKFETHIDIRENLLNTGLRVLISHYKEDEFWAEGMHGKGKNMLGIILMNIRKEYYEKME